MAVKPKAQTEKSPDCPNDEPCPCLYHQMWRVIDKHYLVDMPDGTKEVHMQASEVIWDLTSMLAEVISLCPNEDQKDAIVEGVGKFVRENVGKPPPGAKAGTMLH